MDSFLGRLKVILYLIPIVAAVVILVGIVFLVIRDSRQQAPRRAELPQPMPVLVEIAPPST
jgi:hypothetical protein